jgi:signal transduction histidine kinase
VSQTAYAIVGLTVLLAGLVAVLVFAVLRFGSAIRDVRRQVRDGHTERAFVTSALEDAIRKLRDQERAMTARAESSERLNSEIVSSLTSGLLVVGLDGAIRMLNPAGRRLLRADAGALPPDFRALLRDAPTLAAATEECLSAAQPIVRRPVEVVRAGGISMHLGVTVSPLWDEGGALHGVVCLFSDLTAVVELEEQIRLKDSLARLGELTAGLAHEFRNGLATIHGYGRLLDPERVTPDYASYIDGIRNETDTLGRVVSNFLNFARPTQLTLAPVDSGAVVQRAAEEIGPDAEAAGGTVTVGGEFPTIDGDEVLLRQAFVNLLRNAVEACQGAEIVPRVAVEGTVDHAQRMLRVTVADNGPGVDPALRERIFQPFFTSRSQGTGLGLALVQKIVVTHNGRVSVTAAQPQGAVFQVLLPLPGR